MTGPIGRCVWAESSATMRDYHDAEWGFPVADDRHLFEKISLEGFQSGLSWSTILGKRDDFRRVFLDFEIERVARFGARDVDRLVVDASIVRHRGKIESTVNNARRTLEVVDEFGSLAAYVWGFEPDPAGRPTDPSPDQVAGFVTSPESVALSRDMKRRGWTFVGPTTMYAFMQSMGLVNDHHVGCAIRSRAEAARNRFRRPSARPSAGDLRE